MSLDVSVFKPQDKSEGYPEYPVRCRVDYQRYSSSEYFVGIRRENENEFNDFFMVHIENARVFIQELENQSVNTGEGYSLPDYLGYSPLCAACDTSIKEDSSMLKLTRSALNLFTHGNCLPKLLDEVRQALDTHDLEKQI